MQRPAFILAALLAASAGAQAGTFMDTARVRTVEPEYEHVQVPRNECTSQWVDDARPVAGARNYGGVVIGGVTGALVGRQVGKGHGREAATALGAVVGALAGDHLANRHGDGFYDATPRQVSSCRTVTDLQTRISGYRVQYEYRGQLYTTFMRDQPGHSLPVRVSVVPVGRDAPAY